MIPLNDKKWKYFEGGYHIKYDASLTLSRLEESSENLDSVWLELWENLYHQGDIGIASYAAVPEISRIARTQKLLDFNPFAITTAIELARGQGRNPELPDWLADDYFQALRDLTKYGCENLNKDWDSGTLKSILALIAIIKGNKDLAELIFEVDEGYEKELLNKFFES